MKLVAEGYNYICLLQASLNFLPAFVLLSDEEAGEKKLTGKNLSGVQQAFLVEKEMGTGLG